MYRVKAQQDAQGLSVPLNQQLQEELLRSPFDFFAFGPRVALAAALSATETAQTVQQSVERLQQLAQDPRPMDVKAQEFNDEVQSQLADYARRGRVLEEDLVRNAAAALPEELRSVLPGNPAQASAQGSAWSFTQGDAATTPTTTVVLGEEEEEEPFDYSTFSATDLRAAQAVAELADLRAAVEGMRSSLEALSGNEDAMKEGMLKVAARDARDALRRRLEQLSPAAMQAGAGQANSNGQGSTRVPVQDAVEEATKLLEDVDTLGV